MTPYYQSNGITIYHGRCEDVLPTLEAVDHAFTDPPYAEQTHAGARSHALEGKRDATGRRKFVGDAVKIIDFESISIGELRAIFDQIGVKVQRWCISFLEWRYVLPLEQQPPCGLRFVRHGVWVKPNGAPQFTGDRPAQGWEAVAIFHKAGGKMRWNGGGLPAVWTDKVPFSGPVGYARLHPAQKPLSLISRLVEQFTDPNDLILDPFMGSGTTLRAAKDLGRKAIGIEIEEKYCEIAAQRLSQEVLV